MKGSYGPLSAWYDQLTGDIPYEAFADFYEKHFADDGGEFKTLLDLCCGTGTLTALMAQRGYELIAVDASPDMLMQASGKAPADKIQPLFLCQDAACLDLYGTVDAAYCSLDGINYIPSEKLGRVFERLHLFIRPYGLLIFDIKTPECLRSLDGGIFVDETDDVMCIWRADFDEGEGCICYGMDIFSRCGKLWRREEEEHIEYAHDPQMLIALLERSGFERIELHTQCPQGNSGRAFITAKNTSIY